MDEEGRDKDKEVWDKETRSEKFVGESLGVEIPTNRH